jgi:hypothetical protein
MKNILYRDTIYGLQASARSRTMAWQLIRNKCYELNQEVPTMEKIVEVRVYNQEYHIWREGEYLGVATWQHDNNLGDAFVKAIVTEKGEAAYEVYIADKWKQL